MGSGRVMAENTVWKPIQGFEGVYEVNQRGDVRSRKTGHYRLLKPKMNWFTGYLFVNLYDGGNFATKTIHRLVAESFIPNPNSLPVVNHKDENKRNNNVENLEWCTGKYNNDYSSHKRRKPVELYTIDGEHVATFTSQRAAAEILGVSTSTISETLKGRLHTCKGYLLKRKEG